MECSERKEKFALYAAVRQYLVDGLVDAALKKKVSRKGIYVVLPTGRSEVRDTTMQVS